MVDVQARVLAAALDDEVDEVLEGLLLGPRVVGPEGLEGEGPGVVEPGQAVEVLDAVEADEGVALDVVEEVARVGCGQGVEPSALLDRGVELERGRLALGPPGLEAGLAAQPVDGGRARRP